MAGMMARWVPGGRGNAPGRPDPDSQLAVKPIYTGGGVHSLTNHRQGWQDEAWDAYRDNVGEFSAVTNWRASAISRANLFVARLSDDAASAPAPVDDQVLCGLLEQLGTGGANGYSQLLKRISIHLDVPGETVLVGTETRDRGQIWFPASTNQVTTWGGDDAIRIDNTGDPDLDYIQIPAPPEGQPPTTVLRRIYEPDPLEPWLSISPARYARKPLRILNRLTDRVNANTLSRLMNKMMLISGDVTLPAMPDRADLHADPQMAGLIYGATTAIENPESPAAVLPIIARAMGDIAGKIELIDFGTSFDEQLVPLFDLFIRRLSLMLNVPPEILLGIGESSNHWNAWLVSADTVRIHLAPTIEMIADALTRAYLRPAIVGLNKQAGRLLYNPNAYTIWYDTNRLTERPNRAEDARADYAAGAIGLDAFLRDVGRNVTDKPDSAEQRARLLTELVMAGVAMADAEPYLRAMGISLDAPGGARTAVPDLGRPGPGSGPQGAPGGAGGAPGGGVPPVGTARVNGSR